MKNCPKKIAIILVNIIVVSPLLFVLVRNFDVIVQAVDVGTSVNVSNTAPSFSVDPYEDPAITSANPVDVGSDVTFKATGTDDNEDDYYLAICKTDAISANASAAPTCTGGAWCVSNTTTNQTEATCSYTTQSGDDESEGWYGFVCDHSAGSSCSSSSQGSGDSGSPFKVNHAPNFTDIDADNADPGGTITFSATASDDDTDGTDDTVKIVVCADDSGATYDGCVGTELCSSTPSTVYELTGSEQTYVVPAGVTTLKAELWGAAGGGNSASSMGPKGGYTEAIFSVTPSESLTLIVGGQGGRSTSGGNYHPAGGYGGGGDGGKSYPTGGGGGGRTEITREDPLPVGDPIAVAGGGGGSCYYFQGGEGGGEEGVDGDQNDPWVTGGGGAGGTQSTGYSQGVGESVSSQAYPYFSGGGGGGYYGGYAGVAESGQTYRQSGGGGSGYCNSSNTSCTTTAGLNNDKDGKVILYESGVSNTTCTYTLPSVIDDDATYNFYAYVFDTHELGSDDNYRSGTYTVNNVAPTVSSVTLNSGSNMTLTSPGPTGTTNFTLTASVTDNNGCSDISTVQGYLYRSALTYSGCDSGGEADNNNCYPEVSCSVDGGTDDCTGSSDASAAYTCTVSMYYHADPTDGSTATDSTWYDQNWLDTIKATDDDTVTGSTEVSTGVELVSYTAFTVTSAIDYGSLQAGSNSDTTNQTTTTTATGNVGLDENLSGTTMTYSTYTIPIANQKYGLTTFDYDLAGTALSGSATEEELNCSKTTVTASPETADVYWGIAIPAVAGAGSYTGTNYIVAIKGEAQDW